MLKNSYTYFRNKIHNGRSDCSCVRYTYTVCIVDILYTKYWKVKTTILINPYSLQKYIKQVQSGI